MNYAQALSQFAALLCDEDVPIAGLTHPERMRHYRANCRLNRIAALQSIFSTVNQLLGEEFFRAMARVYVDSHPADSANLHAMGADFADFVAQFAPAAEYPYLSDVARLDWARWQAYYAPDSPALQISDLAQLAQADFAQYRLHLHPSCQLVQSQQWPIADILAMQNNEHASADLGTGGQQLLISRLQWQAISKGQWAFFSALQAEQTVGIALDHALATEPSTDINQALWFLFSLNLVAHADLAPEICQN